MASSPIPRHVTAVLLILLVGSALLAGRLLAEFVGAIVLALVLVSLSLPLQERLVKLTRGRVKLAAGLTTAILLGGVVGPLLTFVAALTNQALALYTRTRQGPLFAELLQLPSGEGVLGERARRLLAAVGQDPESLADLTSGAARQGALMLYDGLRGLAADALGLALGFGVMVVLVFTLLVEGGRLKAWLMDLSPLPSDQEEALIRRFRLLARAVFLGNGTAAALQGLCGGLGFALFGMGSPVLWGTVIAVLAFLPIVGASVVFLPAAAYLALSGRPGVAAGYLVYNLVYVAVLEYGLKPRLIGDGTRMHAVLAFLSILAGIKLFGVLGLFYGPLVMTIFLALVEIYQERYRPELDEGGGGI